MRGKGLVLGLVVIFLVGQIPIHVAAERSEPTHTWSYYGLKLRLLIENNDFWTTESVSELYFVLTLLDAGSITDLKLLYFQITLVTERNYTGEFTVSNPWSELGDKVRIVGKFAVASEDVNNAGWDIYVASFYYNYSILVDTDSESNLILSTHVYEGTPLSISTFSFIVLWPFPPIILMCFVYWGLYFGLRKFNRRYEGLDAKVERSVKEDTQEPSRYPDDYYDSYQSD